MNSWQLQLKSAFPFAAAVDAGVNGKYEIDVAIDVAVSAPLHGLKPSTNAVQDQQWFMRAWTLYSTSTRL